MKFFKTFLACLLAVIAASAISSFLWMSMLIGMLGSMEGSMTTIKEGSVLEINLAEAITDSPSTDPLAGLDLMSMEAMPQLSLMEVMRALEAAATDDRIKGIYLRLNGMGGAMTGTATLEELRNEIIEFKKSGKFVVAYNENYSQGAYYLASVADKIYIEPKGGMDWSGLSASLMFYKGLLDKLDLKVEVFRPSSCKFKSAVEPYILKEMSPANKTQMQQMVDSYWKTIQQAVAEARGISIEEQNRIADNLEVTLASEAVAHGFVDAAIYEDQMNEIFTELGVTVTDEGYNSVSLGDYAAQVGLNVDNLSASQVAIVYAEGDIVDGEGSGPHIYGNTLAAKIREVRLDEDVKSVVLRVNSPGGSALASDVVWREMELLKAEKPVVVSMGSYAASGGYYISCPADVIVANEMTLTGSIGVFGMMLNTRDALQNKLGVTIDGVKTNTSSGMGTLAPLTKVERAAVMRGVDRVYETFTGHVSKGRNLPIERVLEIAEGRVWTGVDAQQIGLVDGIGGLRMAIALAADKAGLGEDYAVVEKLEAPTGLAAFFAAFSGQVKASWEASELGVMVREYRELQEALSQQGIVMYLPYKVTIE
ncbi:MAG: signal peptide peptidase SppA [Rikenellaceae bacterium]|nr:signal peptide peptidase SppA [Rikenellaceae bacterium]